jgi:DNA-directed RNA polymerase II subunit RPB1
VVEITKPGTYNAGLPIRGGLADPALGAADPRSTCATCKNTYSGSGKVNDCPGHFGRLELAAPVYHVGFMTEVYKLLQCVCINCSRILADTSKPEFAAAAAISNGKRRLRAMLDLCRGRGTCRGPSAPAASGDGDADAEGGASAALGGGCGAPQPQYRRLGLVLSIEYPEGKEGEYGITDRKKDMPAKRAHAILSGISDADARLLGLNPQFARPEWLIITTLPVPPPHVRPSVAHDALTRGEDDVTHKLSDIIKANLAVAAAQRSAQTDIHVDQLIAQLQYHCATLIDNQLPGIPSATQRGSTKPLKAFRERLVGKGGRVRGNLMGKRVDFSARTVITADPILSMHQVCALICVWHARRCACLSPSLFAALPNPHCLIRRPFRIPD